VSAVHLALNLDAAVSPDVTEREPPLFQRPPDEEPTVAVGGVFFTAEQADRSGEYLLL
jgi:hypothetical protein